MLKLLKFLNPFIGSMIIAIAFLFVQAVCDLSLPDYMSNIVNVGIQQGGVENAVPKVIKSSEMEKLLIFMNDKEKDLINNNYTLLDKNSLNFEDYNKNLKKYPELENEGIYKLNTKNKEKLKQLNKVFGKAMIVVSMLEAQGINGIPGIAQALPPGTDISSINTFDVLKMMPQEQIDGILKQVDEKLAEMPESMITQAATSYVKSQYKAAGINTDKLQSNYVILAGLKMVGIALISMVATVIVSFIASRVGAALGRNLRKDVFNKVVDFSNTEFDKFSTASLITRSTNDIQQIQFLTVMILRIVLYAPVMAIGGILKVSKTNVDMFWIIGLAVLLIVMVVAVLFIVVMPKFKIVQNMVDKLNLVSREILTGLPVIRAFHTEKHEEERFDKANKDLTKLNLFVNRAMTFMMPTMMLVMNGITVLIVWVGGHSINDGAMQVGDMMAFIQYAMQIIMSFLMICMISVMLPRAAVSAERVDEVLKSETKIHDPKDPKTLPKNGKGEVAFEHVSFHYPGAEEDVLHDITFTAKPGETTAFIGSTGCGKSTLVNLIPRFYDVTEGKITIDGQDVRDLTQHELRDKLGYVPQKGVLFSGNIASNIMFGNPAGSEQEMTEAAQIAQAVEFIDTKPERYKSPISQGGANVSGGQKQRLSIARAIAKHPDVYIFDDSFSALDYKTDTVLRSALKEKTTDSVVLIVAQRISTILHAEQIIVLDDGKIVGKGTHEELLKTCDAYYQIAASQLSESELKEAMKEED